MKKDAITAKERFNDPKTKIISSKELKRRLGILGLFGKIDFDKGYDYKKERKRVRK